MFSEFFQENIIWFGLLFAMITMLYIDIQRNSLGGFKKVSPAEVPVLQRDALLIVDISKANEFKEGHITDSINLPATKFSIEDKVFEKADKDGNVVVVDQTGMSAGAIAKKIKDAGFNNVFVLDGGILNWRKENFPIAKS